MRLRYLDFIIPYRLPPTLLNSLTKNTLTLGGICICCAPPSLKAFERAERKGAKDDKSNSNTHSSEGSRVRVESIGEGLEGLMSLREGVSVSSSLSSSSCCETGTESGGGIAETVIAGNIRSGKESSLNENMGGGCCGDTAGIDVGGMSGDGCCGNTGNVGVEGNSGGCCGGSNAEMELEGDGGGGGCCCGGVNEIGTDLDDSDVETDQKGV